MLLSRLCAPVLAAEVSDPAFSRRAADALRRAFPLLWRDQPVAAFAELAPFQLQPVSLGQHYRYLFIEALAVRRQGQPALAAALLEEARDLGRRLGTVQDSALLDTELSKSYYFAQQPKEGANAAQRGLDTLQDRSIYFSPWPVPLFVELQHRLGECQLQLGQFESARRVLYDAFRAARASARNCHLALKSGVIAWDLAYLHQFTGDLELAHSFALEALRLVTAYGERNVRARLHTAYANILLEQAVPLGSSRADPGREYLLVKAQDNIAEARILLIGSDDRAALDLTDLAHAHMSQLINLDHDRFGTLRRIEYIAQEHEDNVLVGKIAYGLALELLARGETVSAIENLRFALHIFGSYPAAERVAAFKLLRLLEEWMVI